MIAVTVEQFLQAAVRLLGDYANFSGDVLYSAMRTLAPGRFYFLGINPGGRPDGARIAETVACTDESNQYLDACWATGNRKVAYAAGRAPLQQRCRSLFKHLKHASGLNEPITDVLCTNLIFRTAQSVSKLKPTSAEMDASWSVHEYMLGIVQPKVIIAYGKWPFDEFTKRLTLRPDRPAPAGHGTWKLRSARGKCRWPNSAGECHAVLIGLPHLSRYAICDQEGCLSARGQVAVEFIRERARSDFGGSES